MSRKKLPPRLYFDRGRNSWAIRYEHWMRRTGLKFEQKDQADQLLQKILDRTSWARGVRRLKPKRQKRAEAPWARSRLHGVVYFVSAANHYPIKIGFSAVHNLQKRLSELQVANPEILQILTTHPATFAQEQIIHGLLAEYRLSGEWFRRGPQVMELLEAARNQERLAWIKRDRSRSILSETVPILEIN